MIDQLVRTLAHTFGGPTTRRPLTLDETALGLTTCYLNAFALLEDARCLIQEDRYPRAAALIVLSLEELAKIPDLHDTAVRAAITRSETGWTEFWRRFQSHESKQKRMADYAKRLTESLGGATIWENPGPYKDFLPGDLGRSLDVFKQRAFYVDFWNDRFVMPGSIPPELPDIVDALYAIALERADSFEALHRSTTRSKRLLEENIALSTGMADKEPHQRHPHNGPDEPAEELRIDLHTLLANRSSAVIPDYQSVYAHAERLSAGASSELVEGAMSSEGLVLAARIQEKRLRTAGLRALQMLKLLYGFAEQRGVRLELPDLSNEPTDE